MKRILTGAALNSHLIRVWQHIQRKYENLGEGRINYYAHALLLAVQWDNFANKKQQIQLAAQLARTMQTLLPKDHDLPLVLNYLQDKGWEEENEGLIYHEDDQEKLIYASTITELFATYHLMPLRWGPTRWPEQESNLLDELKRRANREEGPKEYGIPSRWRDAKRRRCLNGHVSDRVVKSEMLDRNACLACRAPVYLTFPEDKEGPLQITEPVGLAKFIATCDMRPCEDKQEYGYEACKECHQMHLINQ